MHYQDLPHSGDEGFSPDELAAVEAPLDECDRLVVRAYWERVVTEELGETVELEDDRSTSSGPAAEVVPFPSALRHRRIDADAAA